MAAMREKRQNSSDDMKAVARGMITRGTARMEEIAFRADSTRRSDRRSNHPASGPSSRGHHRRALVPHGALLGLRQERLQIDEYGDPDKWKDCAFMRLHAPYQNIKPNVRYPATFFYLSTIDDIIPAGHARIGAAKLKATSNSVYHHDYVEDGHAVGADGVEHASRCFLAVGLQ
jgi:prolyl oligopeptidase